MHVGAGTSQRSMCRALIRGWGCNMTDKSPPSNGNCVAQKDLLESVCVCDNFHAYVVLRPWTVVHQQDSPKCDTQQLQRSGSHLSALCMGLGNGFLKTGLDRFDHKSLLFLIYTRLCMYTIFSFRYIMFFCLQ